MAEPTAPVKEEQKPPQHPSEILREHKEYQKSEGTPKISIGDTVLLRNGERDVVPGIVVNDFGSENTGGTVAVVVFLSTPFETGMPIKLVPDAQLETADIPLKNLIEERYRWWSPRGANRRDLVKELEQAEKERSAAS